MLKQLIQRLLDSRTTPEEAGHSAMPSPTEVSLTPSVTSKEVWGDVCTGTASSDGYIRMSFSATSPEALGSAKSFGAVVFSTPQLKGDIVSVVCPVAKGRAYAMSARNATGISCAFVKLIGSIGGGYKLLVRRALSCLRPSFNCLPRSFCKAKSLGFQNNQLLSSVRALISLAQAPQISLVTSLRATAGRLLGAIQLQSQLLRSKSKTGRWHLLPYLTETLRELESVVMLKKGHRLSSCAVAEVQPIILFGSTKQVQTFNPLTGGALC